MRAQGALEYLIIIAAVLGISAVVVLFIGGAFIGSSGGADLSKCRLAAANCQKDMATGLSSTCPYCETACVDSSGKDLLDKTPGCGFACQQCKKGTAPSGSASAPPIAYLKLDDGSGITARDSAGSSLGIFSGETFNDGILLNPAGPLWTSGKYGNALSFDGVDDTVSWSYAEPANTFTIMAWVKATATHEIDSESIGSTTGTFGQKYVFWPYQKGLNGGAGVSVGTNGISVYEHGNSYMPPLAVYAGTIGTDWNHIAVVYTNKQPKIYLNGALVRTGLTSTRPNVYAPNVTGGGIYGYFAGLVDSVRVFSRDLIPAEIQAEMKSQRPVVRPVGAWEFDEGIGLSANDSHIWVAGKSGSALSFDGINDYADFGSNPSLNFVNYTIEGWAKPATTGVAGRHLVERGGVGGSGYLIQLWDNNYIYFYQMVNTGLTGYYDIAQNTPFSHDSTFHYFAMTFTYDGTTSILTSFFDGVQKNSRSISAAPIPPSASDKLKLGLGPYNGALDEIKIYNYALPASEILAHYNALK